MTDPVHNHLAGSARYAIMAGSVNGIEFHHDASPDPTPAARAADELAKVVLAQWRDEANLRGLRGRAPMAVPWEADWEPDREPGAPAAGPAGLVAKVGGLSPLRLMITGPGGAGKSSVAVLLVLGLLERRAAGEAVPVILSMPDWDPGQEGFETWVVRRIREDYGGHTTGLDQRTAETLVRDRMIVPVLDGFDELPPPSRTRAAAALARSLGPADPLVLTSRPEAHEQGVADSLLLLDMPVLRAGPVPARAGRDYLARACHPRRLPAWEPVFGELAAHPGGALATVLSSPLMLWLAATVYSAPGSDPAELLDASRLPGPDAVEGHLLDGLVPAVCSQGPPPDHLPGRVRQRDPDRALRYHRFLARQLGRRRTQDIAWWQIRSPLTEPAVWGAVVLAGVAVCGALVGCAVAALLTATGAVPARWGFLRVAEALNAVSGFATLATVLGRLATRHLFNGFEDRPRRPAGVRGRLLTGLAGAVLTGLGVFGSGGRGAVLLVFLLPVLSGVILTGPAESGTATRPGLLLLDERRIAVAEAALVAPAVAGIAVAFFDWPDGSLVAGGFLTGWLCSAAVLAAFTKWGRWTATRLALAARGHLPWDVLGFLEDARRSGVLRQVGGVHQYRHAGLRLRLAGPGAGDPSEGAPAPPEVRTRSSIRSLGALRMLGLDLVVPVLVYLVVVSPLSAEGGYRADWQRSWELVGAQWTLFVALGAVLLLAALALRAVATELRIDADGIRLSGGRRLRLRWEDVAEVRVRRTEAPRGVKAAFPGLPAGYVLAVRPHPDRTVPRLRADAEGWARVWDLGDAAMVPIEVEVALARFAAERWDPRL
ncbi:hypothetical protein [Kitasatospora indigofera]|uniref:hypothetical protein n=3 Tax=Kitasatospora indigofera TaxID=67307 RepID=UPI003697052D